MYVHEFVKGPFIYSSEAEAVGFFPAPPCCLAYSSSLYFLTHPEPSIVCKISNNASKLGVSALQKTFGSALDNCIQRHERGCIVAFRLSVVCLPAFFRFPNTVPATSISKSDVQR
jgi:hypothetical protein